MWAVLDSNQRPLRCERSALTASANSPRREVQHNRHQLPPPPPPPPPPAPPPENPLPPLEPGVEEMADPRVEEKPCKDEESTTALNGPLPMYHEAVCLLMSMSLNARAQRSTQPNTIAYGR